MEMNVRYLFIILIISNWEIYVTPIRFKYIEEAEILSRLTNDTNDPCLRECVTGKNMQCLYTFIVESDTSMGVRCKNCPYKESDCSLPGCVPGGGIQRPIVTVNRRTPGPDIQVCEGDTVIVDVINALKMEGLTIHWHGIHQVNTPYMDGTPYITQCPVLPYNKFRYQFVASPAGTHMWHGHVAFQESDGLYGKLIVRRQEEENFKKLYDFDLPEHSIAVWHWYDWSTQGILEKILHINGSVFGYGILINGKGVLKEFKNSDLMYNAHATPREIFYVTQGRRYLFRTMTNSAIYCPIQVSIDHHTMYMVATDTSNFEPVEVDSFMMSAGERFNFILYANQREGCYWMRFRGIGDCGEMKSSIHQEAYVCYHGSRPTRFPYERPTYDEGRRSGILLNPVEIVDAKYENNSLIHVNELKSMEPLEVNVSGKPNVTLYIQLHNQIYDLNFPGPWPQFNNITFEFPEKPLLSQGHELQSESLCTAETGKNFCVRGYCQCPYVEEIPLDSLVEMVLVDISVNRQQDHPVHLHGFQFYIVAMEAVGYNVSFENIKERNEKGEIRKNFIKVPGKDTLSVPNKGFSVIRFIASNPGYWLFHCHVSNHMELGMAMVLKVGEKSQMSKIPNNFPQCGNWVFMPENSGGNASLFVPLFWVVLICLISII